VEVDWADARWPVRPNTYAFRRTEVSAAITSLQQGEPSSSGRSGGPPRAGRLLRGAFDEVGDLIGDRAGRRGHVAAAGSRAVADRSRQAHRRWETTEVLVLSRGSADHTQRGTVMIRA